MTRTPNATAAADSGIGKGTAMAKQNDVRDYARIAYVSAQKPGRPRWTELAVYYKADGQPPFVAEVIGETTYPDEERRVKRNGGEDVDRAMRLFDAGGLRDEILDQVGIWLRLQGTVQTARQPSPAIAELVGAAEACEDALKRAVAYILAEGSHPAPIAEYDAIAARLRKAIEEVRRG